MPESVYKVIELVGTSTESWEKAAKAAGEEAAILGISPPISLAVTVLTSLTAEDLRNDLNIGKTPEEQVVSLALLAKECGMRGVVSSPKEAAAIRKAVGKDFVIVTPGVRPAWAATDDQKRFTTPLEAVNAGADFLVIGRPILKADDPAEANLVLRTEPHPQPASLPRAESPGCSFRNCQK